MINRFRTATDFFKPERFALVISSGISFCCIVIVVSLSNQIDLIFFVIMILAFAGPLHMFVSFKSIDESVRMAGYPEYQLKSTLWGLAIASAAISIGITIVFLAKST
jgi:hypothetical protein